MQREDVISKEILDILIIGAGPIGLTCAIEAKKNNLSYLILDKGPLVNSIFRFPTNMTFFSTSKLLEIGDIPFISHNDKPNRKEALEYFRRVHESWKLNAHFYEQVTHVEKKSDHLFAIHSVSSTYMAKNVIVATGFYDHARKMNVPGEGLAKVKHYYDEPHPYVDQKVLVVGAANSACDVALELYQKGAEVTMAIRGNAINERVKYWIKPNIENRIKEGSIKSYFSTEVKEIGVENVTLVTPNGEVVVENDFVLAMTGYQPDFDFLLSLGIQCDEKDGSLEYDEASFQTTSTGIYLAGVVCGGLKTNKFFIENAKDHSEKIIQHILTTMDN